VGALFARGGHASLMGTEKFVSRAGYGAPFLFFCIFLYFLSFFCLFLSFSLSRLSTGDHCAGLAILSATLGAHFQHFGSSSLDSISVCFLGTFDYKYKW